MRNKVNVLWLDDKFDEHAEKLIALSTKSFDENGYEAVFLKCSNVSEAQKILDNPKLKIDFFVSDFKLANSGEDCFTGFDFLIELRKKDYLKQFFVLYSNYSTDTIEKKLVEKIAKDTGCLHFINNFYFFGLSTNKSLNKKEFDNSIKLALIKWDELNGLRGEFAFVCSSIEWTVRQVLFHAKSSCKYINPDELNHNLVESDILQYVKENKADLFENEFIDKFASDWDEIRITRNDLEHHPTIYKEDICQYAIEIKDKIYKEDETIKYRQKLHSFVSDFKKFIIKICENDDRLSTIFDEESFKSL